MSRSAHRLHVLLAAGLAVLAVGCSDEASEPAVEPFSITVTVLDPAGTPLANTPVVILPALPPGVLQDDKQAGRAMPAAVAVPFTVGDDCRVDLEIRDVAGGHVRQLVDDVEARAGAHTLHWDGRDDDGADQLTGWYEAVLVCRDAAAGEVLFEASRNMLRIDLDSDLTPFTTGADGTVTITDRRLVPGFWDLPAVRQIDENGDWVGLFVLTEATQLRAAGGRTTFDAVDGPQSVTVHAAAAGSAPPAAVTRSGVDLPSRRDGPEGFALIDPRPNPFN
ncbi:MAG: hypothetical protein R3D98_01055 [Candidatus Krumholzibacteriia bacterium]